MWLRDAGRNSSKWFVSGSREQVFDYNDDCDVRTSLPNNVIVGSSLGSGGLAKSAGRSSALLQLGDCNALR